MAKPASAGTAAVVAIACVSLMLAMPAGAGEADYEPDDVHEHGAPYFGEAKDIKGLTPVDNVRIKVQLKGRFQFFIVQTDEEGRFRRNGLGTEVDPANVEYTCEKQGYRTVDISTRRLARDKFAPVEIECLLEKS